MTRSYSFLFVILGLGVLLTFGLGTGSHSLPKWLFLFLAAAALTVWAGYQLWLSNVIHLDRADLALLVFGLYAALSLTWAPDPAGGALQLAGIIAFVVFVLHARSCTPDQLTFPLTLTCIVAMTIILLRSGLSAKSNGGFGNENYMAEMLLICLPFSGLWFQSRQQPDRWIGLVLITATLAALVFYNASRIEFLVVPGTMWAALIVWLMSRGQLKMALCITSGIALVSVICLIVLNDRILQFEPIAERAEIYVNATLLWLDYPIIGTGIGGFDYLYPEYQQRHLYYLPEIRGLTLESPFFFADAAHNEPLQILVETGVVGLLLVLWFIFELVRNTIHTTEKTPLIFACGIAVASFGIIALVNFPLRNPGTLALGAMAIGAFSPRNTRLTFFHSRDIPAMLAKSLCLLCVLTLPLAITGIYAAYSAARHAGYARALLELSPRDSFERALAAVKSFPLSPAHRRQLPLSYVDWLSKDKNRQPALDQNHARFFAIGQTTGPKNPGLQITRIKFLVLAGLTTQSKVEVEAILQSLKNLVPALSEVHVAEAIYAHQLQDSARALKAFETAQRVAQNTNTSEQRIIGIRRQLGY